MSAGWAVNQLAIAPKLRQRRFALLPLRGPGAVFTDVQGRAPGESTTPSELSDLISSISTVGVLEPVLVEETPDPAGGPSVLRLAAGERRLRAARWGATHQPDNPHFAALPAVVLPGPLSEEERRIWQLVENLARQPLRPGELAAALLLHRSAVLLGKLVAAGIPVPTEVYSIADPAERFRALDRLRGNNTAAAAPWPEVLQRLGLQLTPRKARELVRAFGALPRELSEDMDDAKVTLATRIRFAQLHNGRAEAAEGIWAAVRERGRVDLLPAALTAAADIDEPTACVAAAETAQEQGNAARADTLRRHHQGPPERPPTNGLVTAALRALRELAAAGTALSTYDAASLRLLTDQITAASSATVQGGPE